VNDQYDTLKEGAGDGLVYSLKNLVNDLYARDISLKVSSSLATKRGQGEFVGAIAPYGYRKSEEDRHRLAVDADAAPIVRDIFRWRLEGEGFARIARRLNDAGVPSPAAYRYEKGYWAKKIQPITNRLCGEYGLSTIDIEEHGRKRNERYKDWNEFRDGKFIWREMIQRDVDACIMQADGGK